MYERINKNTLGNFLKGRERFIHVSKHWIINPLLTKAKELGLPFDGAETILVSKEGTRNVGKNKDKREKRALHGVRK